MKMKHALNICLSHLWVCWCDCIWVRRVTVCGSELRCWGCGWCWRRNLAMMSPWTLFVWSSLSLPIFLCRGIIEINIYYFQYLLSSTAYSYLLMLSRRKWFWYQETVYYGSSKDSHTSHEFLFNLQEKSIYKIQIPINIPLLQSIIFPKVSHLDIQ